MLRGSARRRVHRPLLLLRPGAGLQPASVCPCGKGRQHRDCALILLGKNIPLVPVVSPDSHEHIARYSEPLLGL